MQLTKRQVRRRKLKILFGSVDSSGFLSKLFLYIILIGISFIFLYPVLKMTVTSFMSLEDLIDPTVNWVPSVMMLENYTKAAQVLNFKNSLWDSILVSLVPTIFSVLSSALIGYGFSQYEFPGKKIWFAAVVLVFLVPTILLNIPTYVLYNSLGILKSLKAYMYPAMLGFGLRQPVFIFIFYQFFNGIPHELSEAAEVDGANAFQTFVKIAVPLAIPAFIITTLYSFVWYWNETNLAISYFQGNIQPFKLPCHNLKICIGNYFRVVMLVWIALVTFNEGFYLLERCYRYYLYWYFTHLLKNGSWKVPTEPVLPETNHKRNEKEDFMKIFKRIYCLLP